MRRNSIPLLTTLVFLLACVSSVSAETTAVNVPVNARLYATNQRHGHVFTNRQLKGYGTTTESDEERVGLGPLTGLVHAATSKIDDFIAPAKYNYLVNNLRIGNSVEEALTSSQLKTLSQFVAKFRNKNPGKYISSIAPLTAKYGDDVVARALVQLERDGDMTDLVRQLRGEQLMDWLRTGKSVDDVFNLLKLKEDGYKLLHSRKLRALEDYITLYNREKSTDETLVKVLATGFGGDGNLVALLEQAKKHVRSVYKASSLDAALQTKWQSEKLPPMNVWSRLQFSDDVNEAISSGKLDMYYKYISENYRKSRGSVLERYIAKYGEVEVAKALVTAKGNDATRKLATRLQKQQLEGWLATKKFPDDVFVLLKIKDDGILFTRSRKLKTLTTYIKMYNTHKKTQDQADIFRVVINGFGGDAAFARVVVKGVTMPDSPEMFRTAQNYEDALFKGWRQSQIEPKDVITKVFNKENGAASSLETEIAARYSEFYKRKTPAAS
ncbi:hypothetical protein L914_14312 [Phytophthora nicotianae]|uniref:RxLR effector protein n=2 Tax=Phytophthora nicotianae TaxID=4792 RepID=V9EKR5_PHYNI|nr:hypothetical protein F443_14893 [Phytophthora nicotianae P1569]ETM39546.1 hypothetical protein L914_14312 [Phytophthora nicotianae]